MYDLLIRAYRASDFAACLRLFDSKTPEFFTPEGRAEFVAFPNGIQLSARFYDRLEFQVTEVIENGFCPG